LNHTEKAVLESTEALNLDLKSSNRFAIFGAEIFEPTLTSSDWMEINNPAKNVRS
jgi:hypothetical protein